MRYIGCYYRFTLKLYILYILNLSWGVISYLRLRGSFLALK